MDTPKIRKKSGFKDLGVSRFWVNDTPKTGCKYQCKGCGKVTHGRSWGSDEARMHWEGCPFLRTIPDG